MPYNNIIEAIRGIVKSFQSNDNDSTSPVVLNRCCVLGFHEYQSTAKISVDNADAKINTNGQMIF